MTTLEHVSVKHALDRLPSWNGDVCVDGNGDENGIRVGDEVRGKVKGESEGKRRDGDAGKLVTTADDEAQGTPRAEEDEREHERWNGNEKDEGGECGRHGVSGDTCTSALRGITPLGSVSRSESRLDSDSMSMSRSPSRTQSSIRGPLGMGESSAATSWTQPDMEGLGVERLSVDGESKRRPSEEVGYRSSVDRVEEREEVDPSAEEEARAPRYGTEAMSLPNLRIGGTADGDTSRKEEVLVMQEEDIGERWHPLRCSGKEQSQDDGEGEKGEEEDLGFAHPLESEQGGDQSMEMNEKDRWRTFGSSGSSGSDRNPRHLRLEFKPPTPQPWDETDPPTDNNDMFASDYYSTLNSKKFGTLQKGRRRPLIPHSSYYFGPPPPDSSYGTSPVGQIGVHHPREIVRIERDYGGGELTQFSPIFPLELEGRITPTQFHQTINDINEILISAHSIRHAFVDNCLAVITLQLSSLFFTSHYKKEMRRLKRKFEELNTQLYNPVGLNIQWPEKVAFLFLEIEYY